MKKFVSLLLAFSLALCLAACGGSASSAVSGSAASSEAASSEAASSEAAQELSTTDALRIAGLKGPTTMGLVNLLSMEADGTAAMDYDLQLYGAADEIVPLLMKGELDMAAIPANLAATLYQKTNGGIQAVAVNTLGVLYIVENGNSVQSMADLAGRTIVASGKGSTPEYALRYLLTENGIDPDTGVTIDWKSEHSECVASLASGAATIAMLPQPFVTVAQTQLPDLRVALDLTEEWDALDNGSALLTGVVVARADFVKEHPAAVSNFLEQYSASVDWVNANTAEAAELIGGYDIVDATVAEKALPYCNIVCVTGTEMMDMLSGYLSVLWEQDAESVGGGMPNDDFYYGA